MSTRAVATAVALVAAGEVSIERYVQTPAAPDFYGHRWLLNGATCPNGVGKALAALDADMALVYDLPRQGPGVVPVRLREP